MQSPIDLALVAGTTTLLVLLAALLLRDFRTVAAGRLAAAFALGSAAHALTATTGFAAPVTPWHAVLIAVSTANAVIFWLFARALFDDSFQLRRWHAVPWSAVASLVSSIGLVLAPAHLLDPQPAIAMTVISLAFVGLAVGQTIADRSADLVEDRRRLRVFVVVATAIYAAVNAGLQLLVSGTARPALSPPRTSDSAAVVIALACSLMRIRGETLLPAAATPGAVAAPASELRATDRQLLDARRG